MLIVIKFQCCTVIYFHSFTNLPENIISNISVTELQSGISLNWCTENLTPRTYRLHRAVATYWWLSDKAPYFRRWWSHIQFNAQYRKNNDFIWGWTYDQRIEIGIIERWPIQCKKHKPNKPKCLGVNGRFAWCPNAFPCCCNCIHADVKWELNSRAKNMCEMKKGPKTHPWAYWGLLKFCLMGVTQPQTREHSLSFISKHTTRKLDWTL